MQTQPFAYRHTDCCNVGRSDTKTTKKLLDILPIHLLNYDWDNWRNNKRREKLDIEFESFYSCTFVGMHWIQNISLFFCFISNCRDKHHARAYCHRIYREHKSEKNIKIVLEFNFERRRLDSNLNDKKKPITLKRAVLKSSKTKKNSCFCLFVFACRARFKRRRREEVLRRSRMFKECFETWPKNNFMMDLILFSFLIMIKCSAYKHKNYLVYFTRVYYLKINRIKLIQYSPFLRQVYLRLLVAIISDDCS